MTASPLSLSGLPSRSLEWLVGPGALLSSTALTTGQLASLGPIASLVEGAAGGSGDTDTSLIPAAVADTANGLVLDTHATLEDAGHQVTPLNGPIHALTALGETVGLGHLGESGNALTDLGGVAANPTDPGSLAPVLADAGAIATAANGLATSATAAPEAGNGLVGSGSVLQPVETLLNGAVLDTHLSLEDVGHQIPVLNGPIHAVTGLGETIGLGHLGEAGTLLTDLSTAPGALLNGGGLSSLNPVLADLGHVFSATDTLVSSLTGATGGLLGAESPLAPVTTLANTGILDLHTTLEGLSDSVSPLSGPVHGLTNLGETIGLGHLGESGDLLTDAGNLPGALAGGQGLSALQPIITDAGAVTGAAGGLVGDVAGLAGGLTQAVGGAGEGTQGLGTVVGSLTGSLTGVLANAGTGAAGNPVGGLLGGLTGGGEGTHPLVDVGAGPSTATPAADVAVLSPGTEAGHTVQVSAGSAPADQPRLLHPALLTGDAIAFPQTGGADSLVGQVQALVPAVTAPAGVDASHDVAGGLTGDLGLAGIDLGGHAHTQADPQAHAATGGVHLLGL